MRSAVIASRPKAAIPRINLAIVAAAGIWSFRIMGNVDPVAWRRFVVRYSDIRARREQLH